MDPTLIKMSMKTKEIPPLQGRRIDFLKNTYKLDHIELMDGTGTYKEVFTTKKGFVIKRYKKSNFHFFSTGHIPSTLSWAKCVEQKIRSHALFLYEHMPNIFLKLNTFIAEANGIYNVYEIQKELESQNRDISAITSFDSLKTLMNENDNLRSDFLELLCASNKLEDYGLLFDISLFVNFSICREVDVEVESLRLKLFDLSHLILIDRKKYFQALLSGTLPRMITLTHRKVPVHRIFQTRVFFKFLRNYFIERKL